MNTSAKKINLHKFNERTFYIQQIKTTKKIVRKFSNSKEFSPTILINSLLSLVVLPYEKFKISNSGRTFPGKYKEIEKNLGFSPVIFHPIKTCDGNKIEFRKKDIYAYINKFRNGVAHQNIQVCMEGDRIVYIIFFNKYCCQNCKNCKTKNCVQEGLKWQNGGVIDFEIKVTVNQLQIIAIYIADAYLQAIKEEVT